MSLTLEQVKHIADLACLELTDDELVRYRGQLSAILDFFQQLQTVDTSTTHPTSSGYELKSIQRPDQPIPGLDLQDVLSNAPDREGDQFRVPPVFE